MIEYTRKMICDGCGRNTVICVNDIENCYYAPLLREKAPDWVNVDFKRFDEDDSKRIHLCPKCAEKFLALFEKSDDEKKEESDNVDADGNEKRCDKCFYFKPYERSHGLGRCTHGCMTMASHQFCEMFTGM